MELKLQINRPQGQFLQIEQKFRAYVGGFGSGKTFVGCVSQCQHFYEFPKVNQGYFAPTYPQIRDIFYPTIEEVATLMGLRVLIRYGDKEVHFYSGSAYRGTTLCRSMDRPEQIIGFSIGRALVDELDVLPKEKARMAWRKIIARMRDKTPGVKNGIDVTTTPEGFQFVWEQFVKTLTDRPELKRSYGLIQASTYENEKNLPEDYIPSLLDSYTEELIKAYLNGLFVNLRSGTVYRMFDRIKNASNEVVEGNEPIKVGMDFNVGKMAAIVHVMRNGIPHAVDEIKDGVDTPDMIRKLKERYWTYRNGDYERTREIRVYPDASGAQRKSTNAQLSDIQLLQQAGFTVYASSSNPPVKDRVNAMNALFCNARGSRRYFVNPDKCKHYVQCLEQQIWDENGEPDKSAGVDHPNDAGGYFIVSEFPVVKRSAIQENLRL